MSSGQTNSLGTANNTSLLPSSAPTTLPVPSAEDVISMPALRHDDNSYKACVYVSDAVFSPTLVSTEIVRIISPITYNLLRTLCSQDSIKKFPLFFQLIN